jgi:Thioredoxin domain-containing protein
MKKIRKPLALLLAASALLLAGLLAGCRHDKDLTGNDDDDSLSTVQTQQEGALSFTTKDADGNEVTMGSFADAKVVMFNMWEPWCGPCRGELPDLQKLYEKYRSEGFMLVGVYSDTDGLKDIVSENGITYPMIRSCAAFDAFQTGYVPTTFFTDGSGNLLSKECYIGSKSYEEWESVILSYLK